MTVNVLAAIALAAACGAPRPAPMAGPNPVTTPAGSAVQPRRYVDADVRFMQRMIPHHAQALAMTALAGGRTTNDAIRLMAERIDVSQRDEIARMERWLAPRGETVPEAVALHTHRASDTTTTPMPGMLTPAELARLRAASGTEFDRLFLEFMIRHHDGALVMVSELFATDGAGQELDIFRFASDVDADQRAEIRRMRQMLRQLSAQADR